jgi:hypothetical protein
MVDIESARVAAVPEGWLISLAPSAAVAALWLKTKKPPARNRVRHCADREEPERQLCLDAPVIGRELRDPSAGPILMKHEACQFYDAG